MNIPVPYDVAACSYMTSNNIYPDMYICTVAIDDFIIQIDDSAAESFLGFIVAAFSFGQLLTSPLIGVWSSYRPIKEPLIITLIVSTSGNLLYSYAEAFEDDGKWILMLGRFIMGLGAGR